MTVFTQCVPPVLVAALLPAEAASRGTFRAIRQNYGFTPPWDRVDQPAMILSRQIAGSGLT